MDDYIKREAAKRLFADRYDYGLARMLDAIPAADVVEVTHGRWLPVPSSDMVTGKAYSCSECEKMRFGSFKPNYCPNCGAKMDKEV